MSKFLNSFLMIMSVLVASSALAQTGLGSGDPCPGRQMNDGSCVDAPSRSHRHRPSPPVVDTASVDCSKIAAKEALNWALTTEHTAPSTTIGFSELIANDSTSDFQLYDVAVKNIVADPEQWIDVEAPVSIVNGHCVSEPLGVRSRPQNF